jgi:hypothetical protein
VSAIILPLANRAWVLSCGPTGDQA